MKKKWDFLLAIILIPFIPIFDLFDSRGRAVFIIAIILLLIGLIIKYLF